MINSLTSELNSSPFMVLLPIGLILIISKLLSLFFAKIHIPQVIAFLVSGLIVGLLYFIPNNPILGNEYTADGIQVLSKIGVILIMFSAGVETDLKKVKAIGKEAIVITLAGVIFPLLFGFITAYLFRVYCNLDTSYLGDINPIYSDIFYGVILSATSVSISVATLKEFHKLDSKVGTAIISAAIIDDIIGIILLSLIISLSKNGIDSSSSVDFVSMICKSFNITNPAINISLIVAFMLLFFLMTFILGIFIRKLFNYLGNKYPHHIRIPIISLGICFIWSYLAEYFNIADITGAYLVGLILSSTVEHSYIDQKAEMSSTYIFSPIFFASIAMNMYKTQFDFTDPSFILFLVFGLTWVVAGLLGKVVGCFLGARLFKFNSRDSLKIGVGMMARAEVLIVCAQKGIENNLVSSSIMPFTLILILISSFLTPLFLKILYKNEMDNNLKLTDVLTKDINYENIN